MLPLAVGLGAGAVSAVTIGLDYNDGQLTWYGHDLNRQDPFDPVMRPFIKLRDYDVDSDKVKQVAGSTMVVVGSAILIPGPTDVAVGAAGFYFGGPAGAVGAVALYNITGAGLVISGYMLAS